MGEAVDHQQLTFDLDFGAQVFSLKAEDTKTRDEWVKGQKLLMPFDTFDLGQLKDFPLDLGFIEIAELTGVEVNAESPFVQSGAAESTPLGSSPIYQGILQLYSEGFWGRVKWTDRFAVLEEGTLNIFADEKSFTDNAREPMERSKRFFSFLSSFSISTPPVILQPEVASDHFRQTD